MCSILALPPGLGSICSTEANRLRGVHSRNLSSACHHGTVAFSITCEKKARLESFVQKDSQTRCRRKAFRPPPTCTTCAFGFKDLPAARCFEMQSNLRTSELTLARLCRPTASGLLLLVCPESFTTRVGATNFHQQRHLHNLRYILRTVSYCISFGLSWLRLSGGEFVLRGYTRTTLV
jgi:hypothetical protein